MEERLRKLSPQYHQMNNTKVGHFPPAKRFGLIVHGIMILVLAGVSAWGFLNLTRTQVGPMFVNYLLTGSLAFAPIPFLAYRAYALLRADYYIDRDSLAMLWGLRVEDIPLTDVEWVRPASDLTHPLSLPRFRLPGAILGTRRHPDLGVVEFLSKEPGRVGAASDKCFYFQSDHWRGSVVQDDGTTRTYEWDGHYFFDKARGEGGVWVTSFSFNGQTRDPNELPFMPPEYGRYFGPGTGGFITRNEVPADPRCAEKARARSPYRAMDGSATVWGRSSSCPSAA